ncbi:double zinc ribbon domain-containing protein [Scytonema sp. PCC 10023]|uniref:double zinc ribbon domain-containing protein n=1 Tax=Scytonema sp. PCC 10023 TaxID=1680591 RepID=UPI0039C5AFBE
MSVLSGSVAPKPTEPLGCYIQRVRSELALTQAELSQKAGVHIQTIRKIESGHTSRLNQKAKSGLAAALNIPQEYLDAVVKQVPIEQVTLLKFCPKCWTPGTTLDPMWTTQRSKYCFACGAKLRDKCASCNEPILSLKFRFCPYCGEPYKHLSGNTQ